ncbi:DNA-cytosine methyltransferase [Peribacillus asahii]|uniref:DNA-cytosine methyltransferase n=1 Tax=Peribacillus asahii TaxID=228899 RepID=A0A3Q9RK44_9BACI|nr:DNA-cytosine methyltransferase [Peribacillus asahii]
MGSGTTAIACINTNRNYIGFELEKEYFDVANERIYNHKLLEV